MKIAFMDFFEANHNAEEEITHRLKYCFEKQGHNFFVINKKGIFIDNSKYHGQHIDSTDIDFFYTFNHFNGSLILPNTLGAFFHWAPAGFIGQQDAVPYLNNMYCFDDVFGGYESKDSFYDCYNAKMKDASLVHIGSSISKDFMKEPKLTDKYSLFYVGINLEKKLGKQRFGNLFRILDDCNKIVFYGPNEAFGIKGCWDGYQNYKGSIPFDGKSIIDKINDAGIVLAINSIAHHNANTVSNRIYEAAAAGALIISDENEYARKYFGDSIFYVDINKSEEDLSQDIIDIVEWANKNPKQAYEMAKRSQKCFVDNLTLDTMVEKTTNKIKELQNKKSYISNDIIDIVYFSEDKKSCMKNLKALSEQYHQAMNIILVSDIAVYNDIKDKTEMQISFIAAENKNHGELLYQTKSHMKGKSFIIIDDFSDMQKRHLNKLHRILSATNEYFVYSNSHISYDDKKDFLIDYSNLKKDIITLDIQNLFDLEDKILSASIMFNTEILDFIEELELSQIKKHPHIFLMIYLMLRKNNKGKYVNIATSGISNENNLIRLSQKIKDRSYFIENKRITNTLFRDIISIFRYDYNPLLSTEKYAEKDYYLFGFIRLSKYKAKNKKVYKLFNLIPLLKIKYSKIRRRK